MNYAEYAAETENRLGHPLPSTYKRMVSDGLLPNLCALGCPAGARRCLLRNPGKKLRRFRLP